MLNIKRKYSKKGLNRERLDDLSIVTGLQPTRRKQTKFEKWKMVRHQDEKLKLHFIHARAQALRMNKLTTSNLTAMPHGGWDLTKSLYFNKLVSTANENQPETSLFNQQQLPESPIASHAQTRVYSRETTISNVPNLVKTSTTRNVLQGNALQRNVLQPISQNAFPKRRTEAEYWSTFTGPGKLEKSNKSTTVYNMSTQRSSNYGCKSNWLRSGFPMTRQDASVVQQEVASIASANSSGASSVATSYFPINYGQQQGYNGNFPGGPVRSLINSVQPPPVIAPSVDDSESIISQRVDYGYGSVMQGRWVSREQFGDPATTKKYSIAQLMDILIGDTVPSDSDLTRTIFQPGQVMNSSTFNTQAPTACVAQGFTTGPPNPTTSSTLTRIPHAPVAQGFPHFPTNPTISSNLIQLPQGTAAQNFTNNSVNPNIVPSRLLNTERITTTTSVTTSNEQSAYFGQQQPQPTRSEGVTNTRKSVSFMTDSNNNISVERIMYDLFSQDQSGIDNVMASNSTQAEFQSFCELFNSTPSASDNAATLSSTVTNTSSHVPDSQVPLFDYNNNLTAFLNPAEIGATPFPINFEFGTGANISVEALGAQKTLSQQVRDVFDIENLTPTNETVNNTLSTGNYHSSRPVSNDVVPSTSSALPQEDDGYTTSEFF